MVRTILITALLTGCSFDPAGVPGDTPGDGAIPPPIDGDDLDDDGAPPSGRFRKSITVAAGTVGVELTDFPLYVELTDGDLVQQTSLHFVGGDGSTVLDHEVQAWDAGAGHLEAWVRVPALADASATTIYLRYGAFTSTPPENPAGVWQNGFVAVWHLEDDPDGTPGDIADATGATAGNSVSMNGSNRVDGAVGQGLAFGDDLEQITFQNPLAGASIHTISAWIDQDTVAHNSALVVLGNGACNQSRWLHSRFTGGPMAAGFYCDDWTTTGVDVQDDGWTLVHWTYDGAALSRLFRDGALAAGPFLHDGDQLTVGAAGIIGNAPPAFGTPMNFVGGTDEIRLADVVRNDEWIAAEHANQRTPSSFYVVGLAEPVP